MTEAERFNIIIVEEMIDSEIVNRAKRSFIIFCQSLKLQVLCQATSLSSPSQVVKIRFPRQALVLHPFTAKIRRAGSIALLFHGTIVQNLLTLHSFSTKD